MPAISSEISHVPGFRLATLAYTRAHAVVNTNLQKRFYTTTPAVSGAKEVDKADKKSLYYRDLSKERP